MNKRNKLLSKLGSHSNTFPWGDLETLMAQLGYQQQEMAGSRVRFYNPDTGHMVRLHRPHPDNVIKGGALKAVRVALKQEGYL
ncbi:MAG: type II toxin-antitoxin system HicA family toxin [Nitrincola lacisaponensis]|uniref:type II toxin-antitoxin system HicA family toxin n=1 Tax=Nitrincola lacisaponensis TaxID=267850 RepID=UPI00391889D5